MIKIWLDDIREAPNGWTRCRWPSEVIELLKTEKVDELSLDHDLGDDAAGTGYDVVKWLEQQAAEGFQPPRAIYIHTANAAARERMEAGVRSIFWLAGRDSVDHLG